jgi:hypothetical protein
MMIYSFSGLPAWLLFMIIVGGSIGLSCGATLLMHRYYRKLPPVASRDNELIMPFLLAVSGLYGIILGFLVVSVWQTHQTAELGVSQEAAAIISLARYSLTFPEPVRAEIHDQLRRYTEDVLNDEWSIMQVPHAGVELRPAPATADINALWIIYRQLPPNTASFSSLDNLTRYRFLRLESSAGNLPIVFWALLIFGEMIVASLGLILQIEKQRLHIFLMVSLIGLISLCLWFILLFNNPFLGDTQVSSDVFRAVLRFIDTLPG